MGLKTDISATLLDWDSSPQMSIEAAILGSPEQRTDKFSGLPPNFVLYRKLLS